MNALERERDIARSYAGVYRRRGKLVPKPCEVCGETDVQMHHDDYRRPLDVRWLCAKHHRAHHRELRSRSTPGKPLTVPRDPT